MGFWVTTFGTNSLCDYIQIVLFVLSIIVLAHWLVSRNYILVAILYLFICYGIGYLMIKFKDGRWTEPAGLVSYCLLDLVIGLDLIKYISLYQDTGFMPVKNYLILGIHMIFQLIVLTYGIESRFYTLIALSFIGQIGRASCRERVSSPV